MTERRAPLVIEVEGSGLADAPSPAEASPPLDGPVAAERVVMAAASPGGWGLGKTFLSLVLAVFLLWLGIAATDFVTALFARGG